MPAMFVLPFRLHNYKKSTMECAAAAIAHVSIAVVCDSNL